MLSWGADAWPVLIVLSEAAYKVQGPVFIPVVRPYCFRVRMRCTLWLEDYVRKCARFEDDRKWTRRPEPDKAKEAMDGVALQREGAGWTTRAKLLEYKHTSTSMQEGGHLTPMYNAGYVHVKYRITAYLHLLNPGEPPHPFSTVSYRRKKK